jgi:hypothetical protein
MTIAFLLTLGGCGGGESDKGSAFVGPPPSGAAPPPAGPTPPPDTGTPPPSGDIVVENHVTGSVGDGPIINARVRVFGNSGVMLMEASSSDQADYDMVVRTQGRNYAVRIVADQGIDLVTDAPPDFQMVSAILSPSQRTVNNINPFSTLIFEAARMNGGMNNSTVTAARHAVMTRYGFGFDTDVMPSAVETAITNDNVHLMVKTSETLGEMIRRTRDALIASGNNVDGDQVVAALAADLIDGWIDGSGALQSSSRIAAVANVASAAVLVEAMSNQLLVNGVNATEAMDRAVRSVRPNAPAGMSTTSVAIPEAAFLQAARTLRAAAVVAPDPRIDAAIQVMESATPGMLPAQVAAQLPAGLHGVLRQATVDTAYVSQRTIDAVNTTARSTSSSAGGNEPEPTPTPTPPPSEPGPEPTPLPPPPEPGPEPPPPPPEPGPEPPPPPPEPGPEPPPPEPVQPPPPPANNPPVISGTPEPTTLLVGAAWGFTPKASDPDGDPLTFSIAGKPSWMSFDSTTGRLSGTPLAAQVGVYDNIRISVTDGKDTASLPAFSITVSEPPSVGYATVSWSPPTEREDGSALGSVAHYKVYYGTSRSNLDQVATISGTLTSHKVEGLAAGTWYFAVTATCPSGLESEKSAIGSKTIP